MNFGNDGHVSACCWSRPNPLGRYPDQSIEEIWRGAKMQELRDQLERNELPAGCDFCAGQICAGLSWPLAERFDRLAGPTPRADNRGVGHPSRMEFELSNKCNLECIMCSGLLSSSIRANRDQLPPLPLHYDQQFVDQLRPFIPDLKEASFYGGEPFLIDIYYSIWELFIKRNPACSITITTNATVYTAKVKRVLEKLNCQIIVSLDSIEKDTYESIRVNADFARTIENLDAFIAINRRKGKSPSLAACPMVSNWREIPKIVEFANRRGMRIHFPTVLYPEHTSLRGLPAAEKAAIAQFYRSSHSGLHLSAVARHNKRRLDDYARQIEYWIGEDGRPAAGELVSIATPVED
jgi:MoaA/NifB/PqqE/SkfB family radical SAM enzyme